MQIITGTVSVTNKSAMVTGTDTTWLADGVAPGALFKITGDTALYEVGGVVSNTELHLTAPYAGSTASGVAYSISMDFTPNLNLPEISVGDIEIPDLLTRALRILDYAFSYEGGTVNLEALPYEVKVSDKIVLIDGGTTGDLTLPAASVMEGRLLYLRLVNGLADVTIQTTGDDTIDGQSSMPLNSEIYFRTLYSDGAQYYQMDSSAVTALEAANSAAAALASEAAALASEQAAADSVVAAAASQVAAAASAAAALASEQAASTSQTACADSQDVVETIATQVTNLATAESNASASAEAAAASAAEADATVAGMDYFLRTVIAYEFYIREGV